jgi:hypothetical protein
MNDPCITRLIIVLLWKEEVEVIVSNDEIIVMHHSECQM